MPKLIPIKPQKLIKILIKLGFQKRDAEGSHVLFKDKNNNTTIIPIHNKDISKGLLKKILNDTQISVEKYDKLRKSI